MLELVAPGRRTGRVEAYADLAHRVLAGPARLGLTRLVAIDGPSGSGKSVFAARLAVAFAEALGATPPVVQTDDLLNGWGDQFSFWPRLRNRVLEPLRAGRPGAYHRYNWFREEFTPALVSVPAAPVVIIEGVSSARASIRSELTLAVFVTAPARLRLARTLDRDGAQLRAHLIRWRRGERSYFTIDATRRYADVIVDGAAGIPHDPQRCYVQLPPLRHDLTGSRSKPHTGMVDIPSPL